MEQADHVEALRYIIIFRFGITFSLYIGLCLMTVESFTNICSEETYRKSCFQRNKKTFLTVTWILSLLYIIVHIIVSYINDSNVKDISDVGRDAILAANFFMFDVLLMYAFLLRKAKNYAFLLVPSIIMLMFTILVSVPDYIIAVNVDWLKFARLSWSVNSAFDAFIFLTFDRLVRRQLRNLITLNSNNHQFSNEPINVEILNRYAQ